MHKKLIVFFIIALLVSSKAWGVDMRRPLGPTQPMWLVHIDNLYSQDAQQTIDAVPADVRPYVVMNLAITKPEDHDKIEAWLATCQQNSMWAMVQPSSGSRNSMSNTDITEYEALYEKYPNLVGYNFCEQNWFETEDEFPARLKLFCSLLEAAHKYGGYLYVNDSQSLSNNNRNTIAKMKTDARYAAYTKRYADHFIYGDKTTMGYGYYDNESACLGMFLSGHAGHYAIRYDQYSWSYSGHGQVFGTETSGAYEATLAWFSCPEAVMGISIVEHLMMQGATVIDGPEVPIVTCLFDGQQTPSFKNMICDIVRKVVDGTISIPTRDEVLARTKMALAINSSAYTVPDDANIYDGLYQMDGSRTGNKTWLKRSGRYPTIPTVATAADAAAITADYVALSGDNLYSSRWADNAAKVAWFNEQYPEVSTGDLYVARIANGIYAYNPYINTDQEAQASIPFQFNTCGSLGLTFTPHTFGVVKETTDGLDIYLNNYRTNKDAYWADGTEQSMSQYTLQTTYLKPFIANPDDGTLRQSVITITGCSSKPTAQWKDRGSHAASTCTEAYADGTWTLTVSHNGPLDIKVTCQGSATGRETVPTQATVGSISQPTTAPIHNSTAYAYDFEEYADGTELTTSTNPWLPASGSAAGKATIKTVDGSQMLNPAANGTGTNKIGVVSLSQLGAESDYCVTWKELTTGTTKGGLLLRGTADNDGANPGVLSGYYFQTNTSITGGTTKMAIRKIVNNTDGTTAIGNGSSGEKSVTAPAAGAVRWYRATAEGSTLTFDYSDDGANWTNVVTRTDADYTSGTTQLLWGLNTNVTTSYYDDITMRPVAGLPANESRTDYAGADDPEASVAWNSLDTPAPTAVSVTVPAAGYVSFSSAYPLDFTASDVTPYIITSTGSNVVYLKEVITVPAHTGLVLKATAGNYQIPVVSEAPALVDDNLLRATSEAAYTVTAADAGHVYILARVDGTVGFYPAATDLTVPVGYAYLYLTSPNAATMLLLDGTTGIRSIGQMDDLQSDHWYDLQGRRIVKSSNSQIKPGLYIINGHKVVIK